MKRICFLSVMLLLVATMMNAQWRITPEAGVNISKFEDAYTSYKAGVGARIGVGVRYSFKGDDTGWGVRSGLYYTQRTYQANEGYITSSNGSWMQTFTPGGFLSAVQGANPESVRFSEGSCRWDYLQLPVLAQYAWEIVPDIRWHVAAGPYVAVAIAGKHKVSYTDWDLKDKFEHGKYDFDPFKNYKDRFDTGGVIQTGIEVKNVAFLFNYQISLYKRNSVGKSQEVSIGLGYTF